MREGRLARIPLTAKVFPTGGSPGGNRGDSDWRLTRREQGQVRLANHAT